MKLFIKTFGCQMNDRDSEALCGLLLDRGYILVSEPKEAEVILVNTCSVREHAENRAISFLGSLKKNANSKKVIGLIGCMARNRGEELFKRMPHIDLVCGPACFDKIPEYVEKIQQTKLPLTTNLRNTQNAGSSARIIDLEDKLRNEDFYRASFRIESGHAQVVISTGCSNYCSYCVVPYVRGPLRLRNPKDIIDEVKRNVKLGIKKITLLGQNVNDYQYKLSAGDGSAVGGQIPNSKLQIIDFVELLRMIEKIEGIEEMDFVTSHPKNTSRQLLELMAKSKKIKKHLHLPFQSGSNRILKLMNRGYTKEDYLNLVKDYKEIVGGTLSTDVIVGFPTETEEDFSETKDVLERVRFKYAYIFKYSPRPNTLALKLEDDVPLKEKERRHKILLDLQKKISLESINGE
ncbi:MAG: tRNA (N6-isopentenyl adenosine(37)-C2)-methylthiotransferase MiaB [Candidatus Omnitrophota bacterium]|nr:MAG: tRNA (N6-isopentenyl adenosine(37)-C2)-methylthiotransferase MiaB [Candidatus Omnitrophota bacterium]